MPHDDPGEYVNRPIQHRNPRRQEVQVASPPRWPALHEWERQIEQRGSPDGARFTPIKTRMRDQNRDAADQQANKAQRIDPVRDADQSGMPWRIPNLCNSVCNTWDVRGPCRSHDSHRITVSVKWAAP